MSYHLRGPFPFDPESPGAGARAALDAARSGAGPGPSDGADPGIYLIWREAPRGLVGLWVTLSPAWLEAGPLGPPDRSPPLVAALCDAANEAMWWEGLELGSAEDGSSGSGRWSPVIVLEWPPALASRASVYPPGTARAALAEGSLGPGAEGRGAGRWLDDGWAPEQPGPARAEVEEDDGLPARRSLILIARASLERRGEVLAGRGALVAPERLPRPPEREALPLHRWLNLAASDAGDPPTARSVEPGPALGLPGGRVGWALPGWLTRALTPWPPSPTEILPFTLAERDVGVAWRAQLRAAITLSGGVLCVVGLVGSSVWLATRPRLQAAPELPEPAAQPVLSLCSADHQAFVSRLRCHIDALASGVSPDAVTCAEPGPEGELQSAWCGLADRQLDNLAWKGWDYAELAASQACFEVLGQPWTYAAKGSDGHLGDPDRFLRDPDLSIRGLRALVGELDERCARGREALSARVTGAVVAAHVGGDVDEAGALQSAVGAVVSAGLGPELQGCFQAGLREGALSASTYEGLCDQPAPAPASEAWLALSGAARGPLVTRYTRARFGGGAGDLGVWGCHAALSGRERASVLVDWDLGLPVPGSYDQGGTGSQLVLDAGLRRLRAGMDAGPCWRLLSDALALYTPAHPLLSEPSLTGWPSAEQQICGQVCATRYRIAAPGQSPLTLGTDLSICLDPSAPSSPQGGGLDRLRLPWNGGEREGWTAPADEQICAFNLIAQGYLDEGEPALLADGAASAAWAGERGEGSRVAGGSAGLAAESARSLERYGGARGLAACQAVAAECLVEEMLRVTGDASLERHQWRERWRARVEALAAGGEASPWCEAVRPYLHPNGDLPEGELDYPCTKGVDEARRAVEARVVALARQGSTPGGSP